MAVLRECVIEWHDDPEDAYLVTVGIGEVCGDGTPEDDAVFFWFADEEEFEQARAGVGYEFRIIEWFEEDDDE